MLDTFLELLEKSSELLEKSSELLEKSSELLEPLKFSFLLLETPFSRNFE